MIDALIGYAVAAVLAVMGLAAAYMRGKSAERFKQDKAYVETRKRMDDAEYEVIEGIGIDPDAARRWLHERGQSGRDL